MVDSGHRGDKDIISKQVNPKRLRKYLDMLEVLSENRDLKDYDQRG